MKTMFRYLLGGLVGAGGMYLYMNSLQPTNVIGGYAPLHRIHNHICGIHGYAHDMKRSITAHHYCSHLRPDFHQCVIYDSDNPDAKLIGIEYIITEETYNNLDPEEQKLWHSHQYEVKGGLITCPHIPQVVEHQIMKHLIKTYGKTFHTWQIDTNPDLPLGVPKLMMAYTREENMPEAHVRKMYLEMDRLRDDIIKDRKYIEGSDRGVHPNADSWEKGNNKLLIKIVDKNLNNLETKPDEFQHVVYELKLD